MIKLRTELRSDSDLSFHSFRYLNELGVESWDISPLNLISFVWNIRASWVEASAAFWDIRLLFVYTVVSHAGLCVGKYIG